MRFGVFGLRNNLEAHDASFLEVAMTISPPWLENYEHPVVDPHVSHFKHVPLRTSVKFPHVPQASPS
jgi:hypothetical protein